MAFGAHVRDRFLADPDGLKFGSGHGHWLPWWVNWGLVLFTPAVMTLAAYFLTRAALNSRE